MYFLPGILEDFVLAVVHHLIFSGFHIIVCGLDSIVARRWINGMLVGLNLLLMNFCIVYIKNSITLRTVLALKDI